MFRNLQWDRRAAALALGRWGFGVMFLVLAIGKFRTGVGTFAAGMTKQFESAWLPAPLVKAFGYALPFVELVLGALLVVGLFRDATLLATGLLLLVLTFGQAVLGSPGVFNNLVLTWMVALLLFAGADDAWGISRRTRRDGATAAGGARRATGSGAPG